ncbi:hypothetical protein [Delftia acidovorans]|uniref:hypothetical protein n=1 Tax=Delftia acidovorans TaxID=80866 RepID=UPI000F4CFFC9|nr:hypothetical protein [Delftia acidovorans]
MFQLTLEAVNRIQEDRLYKVSKIGKRLQLEAGPQTRSNGLYWLYTSYSDSELRLAAPSPQRKSVPINTIAAYRENLGMICSRKVDGFRVVYNGIGGIGHRGHGGLRERILQEFRGGEGTGSLAICETSLRDLTRWRYSYVLWSEITHTETIEYLSLAERLETMWRLHFGWPILCGR